MSEFPKYNSNDGCVCMWVILQKVLYYGSKGSSAAAVPLVGGGYLAEFTARRCQPVLGYSASVLHDTAIWASLQGQRF